MLFSFLIQQLRAVIVWRINVSTVSDRGVYAVCATFCYSVIGLSVETSSDNFNRLIKL